MKCIAIAILILSMGCVQTEQVMQEGPVQTDATKTTETPSPAGATATPIPSPAGTPPPISSPAESPAQTPCEQDWQCTVGECADGKRTRTCTDANGCSSQTQYEENCSSIGRVVFSEVMYDPPGKEGTGEWLKLYNPADEDAVMLNWSVSDNSGKWNFSAVAKRKSQLVVARSAEGFRNLTGCDADAAGLNRGLNNDGDFLVMRDDSGKEIDFVAWSGGYNNSYPGWGISAKEGYVIRRVSPENDTDTASDWAVAKPERCD